MNWEIEFSFWGRLFYFEVFSQSAVSSCCVKGTRAQKPSPFPFSCCVCVGRCFMSCAARCVTVASLGKIGEFYFIFEFFATSDIKSEIEAEIMQ